MASSFELTNRAKDGKLADELRELRRAGKSLQEMADAFTADGYEVSIHTVRRWCQQIGLPTNRVPASPVVEELAG